jgi:hypothetical protein
MNTGQDPLVFDAIIGIDGLIRIPDRVREALAPHIDGPIRVRLVPAALAEELQSRGVTGDEIDMIASVQLEERQQVIRFLLAEGSLGKTRRAGRARR